METRIFRVNNQIKGTNYHTEFSMDGVITEETKSISAWNRIKKAHPSVFQKDVENVRIEDLKVW